MINPSSEKFDAKIGGFMELSEFEVAKLRRLLWEIDQGLNKTRFRMYVETRTRAIRLMLSRAQRREKGKLL